MKRIIWTMGTAVWVLSFFLAGCDSMRRLQKSAIEAAVVGQVEPQQLEAVDGTVDFTYTVKFAPKEFHKKMLLKINPKWVYGTQVMNLEPVFLQGEEVKESRYPVVKYDRPSVFSRHMSFKFQEGMQDGVLWADIEAVEKNKSVMMSPVVLNRNGIKVWRQPAFTLNGVSYVPAWAETFVEELPAEAVGVVSGYVMFPLGKSTISPSERHSAVMEQAAEAMEKVLADKKANVLNMLVLVSNSPEGSERLNRNLAVNRFRAAKIFFEKDLKLAGTPMARDPKFVVHQHVAENWDGLYSLLEASHIGNRRQMIRELKNAPNAVRRNALLDAYAAETPELKEEILPMLRRADFFVFYTVPTDLQEEVQLACFMPQLEEKTPAVTACTNWRLLNDLAVVAIDKGEYGRAQKLLETAVTLKQDAAVDNNLGITRACLGHPQEAAGCFDRAKIRKEARHNMGLLLLQNGEYRKAIPYLKEQPDINLAYAQLMNNDNRAAMDTFHKIKMNRALDYYLNAVAAARVKDARVMVSSLAKAIQMQPDLKNWARTDVAFYPYKGDPVYLQVVK